MSTVPNHIAIIPDGNRRWAKAHRLNPWDGHDVGFGLFESLSEEAYKHGVKYITFWTTSYDNMFNRSKTEVKYLIKLLYRELTRPDGISKFIKNKVKVNIIGEWETEVKDQKVINRIKELQEQTKNFTGSVLTFLFVYDGKREMLSAVNSLVKIGKKASEENLRKALWTADLPDVDLVIRTGGEPHWSAGFLMWHTAHSQFYFTDLLWPDFDKKELKKALAEYERRERRLGK